MSVTGAKAIVVIEDDFAIADTLRQMLEGSAYLVQVVGDAQELRPSGSPAALVITDLASRTGYDSASALQTVREARQRTGAPVLVLTAHRAATEDAALAREADAVLTKPFDMNVLLARVEELARH